MVDTSGTISFRPSGFADASTDAGRPASAYACSVTAANETAIAEYAAFCAEATFAPPQSPAWLAAWSRHGGADTLIATLKLGGNPVLCLPLEVTSEGPFRIARHIGGRHANGNFPAVRNGTGIAPGEAELAMIWKAVDRERPDIDLIALERNAREIEGVSSPLLSLPGIASPNVALAVNLDGGFDALLARSSGKRKRKKHRSQTRKFEAAGDFRRFVASTPAETDALLDRFFAMKAERFGKMGIRDVFADEGVRSALRALFAEAAGTSSPRFMLHGLEVAGKVRAVTGSSVCGSRLVCEFGAIVEDELAHASPGDFLFFENIQEACADGFAVYDFSVGDEPYKRLWCDLTNEQFDTFIPLTLRGRLLSATRHAVGGIKRFVKNNETTWKLVKSLRRGRATQAAAQTTDED